MRLWNAYPNLKYEAARDEKLRKQLREFPIGEFPIGEFPISEFPISEFSIREFPIAEFHGTAIHRLFEAQAQKTPDAIAVEFADQQLTYHHLNQRANQLASHLRSLGVAPNQFVGICVERSLDMVIGLLGILKAGGAYVPLDPSYPTERLAFMVADAQVSVLLTQTALLSKLPEHKAQVLCLDTDWSTVTQQSAENLVNNTSTSGNADDLIYVIYTSGSTGTPKGVAVEHKAVHRLVMDTNYIDLNPTDVVAQVSNCSFDAATFEIWGALVNGARLVIVSQDIALTPRTFANFLQAQNITTLFLTTALFNQVAREVPSAFHSLRQVLFGGEAVDPKWVREVLRHKPPARLLHVYGPTESTTFATWHLIETVPEDATTLPIGRPLSNTECYVLDSHLQPVAAGVAGELYIGGVGLAREYLNRPELTAERFISNPWHLGTRLYKTGDLVRCLPNGAIEYLGRLDHQVKLRGFRIELGEIESALRQHPDIRECVVMIREDIPGNKRLVAYLAMSSETALTVGECRQFLSQSLPEYMLPSAFVLLEQLPLTPNGKIDRRALPIPNESRPEVSAPYVAPRTQLEQQIAAIWTTVLGIEGIGIHDSFLELGGHSLLATQVIARVCEVLQVQVPLQTVLAASTIAEFAHAIATSDGGKGSQPIQPVALDQPLPLSFSQQQMWLLAQLEPDTPCYNDAVTLQFTGSLNVAALEQSLNEIIRRHGIWRTKFVAIAGIPHQVIQPHFPFPLSVVDLRTYLPDQQAQTALQLATAQAQRPFDLTQTPLLRATLVQLSETDHRLYLTLHHIIYDGVSLYSVFLKELSALYDAFCAGRPSPLADLTIQYADFAAWQQQELRSETLQPQLDYWTKQLASLPTLQLPTDRPYPAIASLKGSQHCLSLSKELTEQLKALSRQEGVTLYVTLMSAFKTLLHRYTAQDDIPVATVTAGRNRSDIEPLIGCFINTLIIRTDLSGAPSFRELLRRVRSVTLDAYAHQDTPFQKVVEALRLTQKTSQPRSWFQVLFVLAPPWVETDSRWQLSQQDVDTGTTECDLYLELDERPEGLIGRIEYSTDLFDADTIARLAEHFQTLLEGIVAHPEHRLTELPLLTTAEQQQLATWNNTHVEYPEICLHQLIEAQALRTPDAIAVQACEEQLTYQELNQRANQLANHLQSLGITPDGLVGICIERSLEMVIGLLGILKAGGAYVPLDPSYPPERLAFMMADAQVPVLLTQSSLLPQLPPQAQVICLDTDWQTIAQSSVETPLSPVTPDHLAYVIYTSGSTGKPKGAMNTHKGICNRLLWMQDAYQLSDCDRVLQKTPFGFDVSVWEFFWTLMTGARLVVARPEGHKDSAYLAQLIAEQQITTLHFVPSMLQAFLQEPNLEGCQCLKRVICSGEALPFELQERCFDRLNAELHNLYGPTEAAVDVTFWACQRTANRRIVPIGRAIANMQIHLLDAQLHPVPIGVAGELHIGGIGLARGYLNRPDLTAERFIDHPFGDSDRLYKTGDLARYLPDGSIEYLGRIDHQVKLRGFRIELGEIESSLRQHSTVQDCVVIAREDVPGNKRLVAYLVTTTPSPLSELRQFLSRQLPEYMVPSAFVFLEQLPLTPNGKIDRRSLPIPEENRSDFKVEYIAPQTPAQEKIAAIWSALLGVDRVGIHDPFLELGGHSLLATQVMARVNEVFEVQLPLHTLFSTPTVAKFAEAIEQYQMSTQPQMPALVSVVREARRMTLSSIQAKLAGKSKKEFAEKTSAMVFTLPEESDRSRKEHAADIATLPEKNTQTYNTLPIHKSVKTAEEL
ncbi:MAG: amino acid adenylation domain-containing protein [Leptolyngbyaceae cyanobacterium CSU_1_3]|nr:amino acid adenylation domain-containing protein [Leptolyngbyaceae cyanobacterium CSU_1_3]